MRNRLGAPLPLQKMIYEHDLAQDALLLFYSCLSCAGQLRLNPKQNTATLSISPEIFRRLGTPVPENLGA